MNEQKGEGIIQLFVIFMKVNGIERFGRAPHGPRKLSTFCQWLGIPSISAIPCFLFLSRCLAEKRRTQGRNGGKIEKKLRGTPALPWAPTSSHSPTSVALSVPPSSPSGPERAPNGPRVGESKLNHVLFPPPPLSLQSRERRHPAADPGSLHSTPSTPGRAPNGPRVGKQSAAAHVFSYPIAERPVPPSLLHSGGTASSRRLQCSGAPPSSLCSSCPLQGPGELRMGPGPGKQSSVITSPSLPLFELVPVAATKET